ncbi:hypothetical protein [Macrococcoides bohemicum]|uniref:hypothetical protein n=1 Tax=Macrococcoides bohemicum TaxID=1903056 RepID=UPI00193FA410|nr:hypothetical protein [Macrococcus bohemicus]QRN49960.1 hypothetical protein HT586_07080 [Macrococcus bohemicus]
MNENERFKIYPINKYDKAILESHMKKYHDLIKIYKSRPNNISNAQYKRVSSIVLGITELYNTQLTVFEQNLIKLSWWQCEDEKTICNALGSSVLTVKAFQEKILCLVADATGYVR